MKRFFLALALAALPAAAQQFVYPAKGQSPEQQKTDEGACHVWAADQSGFDPTKPASPPPPPPPQGPSGARLKGAAAGAIVGEATTGDSSAGAAAGAVVAGSAHRNAQRQAAAKQQQSAQQQQQSGMASYQKARSACLEGRGYTVR